jgi:uncharacterized protein YoxC
MSCDEIPQEFICPISQRVMEFPCVTSAGHSYEYSEIKRWLSSKSTDPSTNTRLTHLETPINWALRNRIQAWFNDNPQFAHERNANAERPPTQKSAQKSFRLTREPLDNVLQFTGAIEREKTTQGRKESVPAPITANGRTYTFVRGLPDAYGRRELMVRCDASPYVEAPHESLFITSRGIAFYDPTEMLETRILPGTEHKDKCKFGNACNRDSCKYAHPFVCKSGVTCRQRACKFLHPPPSSAVAATPADMAACRYETSCSLSKCRFAHPNGRMSISRVPGDVFLTHSLTLEKLAEPIPLRIAMPDTATEYQFQGEFVFCFEPFPGTWAKNHYAKVTALRFDPSSFRYRTINTYSLAGHYCNSVAGAGRYMVISFWPYEEEAVRTIWECLRVRRELEKTLRSNTHDIQNLQEQVRTLEQQVRAKNEEIATLQRRLGQASTQVVTLQRDLQSQRQATQAAANESKASQRALWEMQQRYENERNERLRLRDPIHVYALDEGTSGFAKEDWTLVLDYHKGANKITLHPPEANGVQQLELAVKNDVFVFDLVVPRRVRSLGFPLPLVPGRLCEGF